MSSLIGQSLDALDTPQLLIDLDVVDANVGKLFAVCKERGVSARTHFKSLKCGGLAKYIASKGGQGFLCAKLNEAEVLADHGITDLLIANQVVGPLKLKRLAQLAKRTKLRVCVDDAQNIADLSKAMTEAGATVGVLIEIDIGMARCGIPPGPDAIPLAQAIQKSPGLRFDGLQGYDGHLQLMTDMAEKKAKCLAGLEQLVGTRKLLEQAGIPVAVVTGAGTGTWEWTAGFPGVTEIQPGSFVLMDVAYHPVRPEFGVSQTLLTTVVSKRPGWYVLDAGSKAISKDFAMPAIKGKPEENVVRLSEEHAKVECDSSNVKVGERREVITAHCCATMNLHRQCFGVRKGRVETVWPIEASGRYD